MILPVRRALLALVVAGLSACAPSGDAPPDTQQPPTSPAPAAEADGPAVRIVEPAEGAEVAGPDVIVRLEVSGLALAPAGDTTAGTGHHHLFLDADVSPAGVPIPKVEGSVVHMGDASTTYTFTGVAPGEHRLIAVVGDAFHVPLDPWVVDTVRFRVR